MYTYSHSQTSSLVNTTFVTDLRYEYLHVIHVQLTVRDWSLITGRGGYKTGGGGGHVKFYPCEKGGRIKF